MVDNEILQIVVFSIFFGVACAAMGARAKVVLEGIEGLSHVILRVTGYVMILAPLAVFCAMTATIAINGLGILVNYAKFMGEFYFGLVCLWALLVVVGFLILGPSVRRLGDAGARASSCSPSPPRVPRRPIPRCWNSSPNSRSRQDLQLRAAAGLFLQPRRHDDVLHLCQRLHRAGLRHQAFARHADCDAAHPDADQQRRGRGPPRVPGVIAATLNQFSLPRRDCC